MVGVLPPNLGFPKAADVWVPREIFPPDRFPVYFYREPKAPDMNIARDELDLGAIAAAPLFWTTGTGLSDEPSRTATLAALDARRRRDVTIHDLDHRHHLWRGDDRRPCRNDDPALLVLFHAVHVETPQYAAAAQ